MQHAIKCYGKEQSGMLNVADQDRGGVHVFRIMRNM